MRNKLNKHPCLVALFTAIFIVGAFIGSSVIAGVQDRSSDIDLMPAHDNYIRLPDVEEPSEFIPETIRTPARGTTYFPTGDLGQLGRTQTREPPDDETWLANDEGNLMYKGEVQYAVAGRTVLINSVRDLTFLEGDTTGASVFWMDWGNHYIVDFYAIGRSGGTDEPISGTTWVRISGVSGIFRSVLEKDDQKTVTVEIAQTGETGYVLLQSGNSIFQAWAPLNSGCTTYVGPGGDSGATVVREGDSGVTHQTLMVTEDTNGVVPTNTVTNVTDGGFDSEVQKLGDWKIWKAQYLAGVSVVPTRKHIVSEDAVTAGNVVYIDSVDDLTQWEVSTTGEDISGQSHFQMEAGKVYLVDLAAIELSGSKVDLASSHMVGWSAVTALLPLATQATDGSTIKVIMKSDDSGPAGGVTTIEIWPAPAAGSTVYRGYDLLGQNALACQSATSFFSNAYTGTTLIDVRGESMEYTLSFNTGVSAVPSEINLINY